MRPAEKIVIAPEELADAHVDAELAQHLSFGMAPARVEEPKTKLIYRPWFALMLAGGLGALVGWAVIEPVYDDTLELSGRIQVVSPSTVRVAGVDLLVVPQTEIREGEVAISMQKLYGERPVRARVIQVPAAEGEPVLLAAQIELLPEEEDVPTSVDLGLLGLRHLLTSLLIFPLVAGFIGLAVGAADGLLSRALHRSAVCGLVGLAAGLGIGLVASVFAQVLYSLGQRGIDVLSDDGARPSVVAFLAQMATRGIAWSLAGAAMGLGQGIALRSRRLLVNGLLGGLVGGLLGGLLFDPIGYVFEGESLAATANLSRAIGCVTIGMVTGLMIGIVELLAREAWVKLLTGPLTGKEFILHRTQTVIGSSPKADIYLFKDSEVEPTHALIHTLGEGYEIEDKKTGAGTYVNGERVSRRRLASGDQIRIGKTVFSFSLKESA